MASEQDIESFAQRIGGGPLGLAHHRPESWAIATNCLGNVLKKVEKSAGRSIYGWMFQLKLPAFGEYLIAIHHAVWCSPVGALFDVTPFHSDPINHPLVAGDGSVYFLVDQKARPVQTERMLAPQPSKFFPLGENAELVAYVKQLSANEIEACRKVYEEHG